MAVDLETLDEVQLDDDGENRGDDGANEGASLEAVCMDNNGGEAALGSSVAEAVAEEVDEAVELDGRRLKGVVTDDGSFPKEGTAINGGDYEEALIGVKLYEGAVSKDNSNIMNLNFCLPSSSLSPIINQPLFYNRNSVILSHKNSIEFSDKMGVGFSNFMGMVEGSLPCMDVRPWKMFLSLRWLRWREMVRWDALMKVVWRGQRR